MPSQFQQNETALCLNLSDVGLSKVYPMGKQIHGKKTLKKKSYFLESTCVCMLVQVFAHFLRHTHCCELICAPQSCHGETLPSPHNVIKALVLHVTFSLLSRETNKLPLYLSQ